MTRSALVPSSGVWSRTAWRTSSSERPGADARRGGAGGGAARAAGPVLAVGDVGEDDPLGGDGADLAAGDLLAPPPRAAGRAWGLAGGAADRWGADVGPPGLHGLRAPVGRVSAHERAGPI